MAELGTVVALIKSMSGADPAVIEQAVQDWLDDHPEATTTVQDGSITEAKLAQDVLAELGEIDELKEAIADINDEIFIKSDNLYNPALQTSETISPHYYFNGVPYSTTQFDAVWNCTALIEIEPSTQYTVGLVPDIGGVTKPWNQAGAGGFCYDSDGEYIVSSGFTGNTFTTPATAKYIRFNYQIFNGFSLSELNDRCVLIKGSTLPEEYIPYKNESIDDRVAEIESNMVAKCLWYKRTGAKLEVGYFYGDNKDIIITLDKFGGNNLPDLKKVETIPHGLNYETATRTTLWDNGTDALSPYVVRSVNDGDGDDPTGYSFTGGQHQYNNQGSGSTPTARCVGVTYLADGIEIDDGDKGYANRIHTEWENRVQGANTKKTDGTGREIIKVLHTADFDGVDVKVTTGIIPLEDVLMYTFYGYQFLCADIYYPKLRYHTSANRSETVITSSSVSSNSGDLIGYSWHADDPNGENRVEVSIDPLFDMGRRDYATGEKAMFLSWNKVYFSIVRNQTAMNEGELFQLKGAYKFTPVL